jgi:hypothetical protein
MSQIFSSKDAFLAGLSKDENGYVSRECPTCDGYFKVKPRTGLKGENPSCHCPYCGHMGPYTMFCSTEQLEYARAVATRKLTGQFLRAMRKAGHQPDISSLLSGSSATRRAFAPCREQALEQELVCETCGAAYAVFAVFSYCPDCRIRHSFQILRENFSVTKKMLSLTDSIDANVRDTLIEHALIAAISAFDGFGRDLVKSRASRSHSPDQVAAITFQEIVKARHMMLTLFNIDLSSVLNDQEWKRIQIAFQKHGFVSQSVISTASEPSVVPALSEEPAGRKVLVTHGEVEMLLLSLQRVARFLFNSL